MNQYLTLENAGDQFVGRVAALLPMFTKEFGVLPPRFPDSLYKAHIPRPEEDEPEEVTQTRDDVALIEEALTGMFGDPYMFGEGFSAVLRVCLASLCYHKDWLQKLPLSHPFLHCWLSTNISKWRRLQTIVGPLKYDGDDGMRSSTIRPNVNRPPIYVCRPPYAPMSIVRQYMSAVHPTPQCQSSAERRVCLRTPPSVDTS